MLVPETGGHEQQSYYVWGAKSKAFSQTGRATRGYPAVNAKTGEIGFLKDTWRPIQDDVYKESETLQELNAKGVRNIPKILCGDDLETISPGQRTRAHEFWNKPWRRWTDKCETLVERRHHRFVEHVVGTPLKEVKSMKHLLEVLYDAFVAHRDAYEKCDILHRDVSGGNILVAQDGTGVLNDWDLAKTKAAIEKGPRSHYRTGTWQFISARLLKNGSLQHLVQDDLESFFYVALYYGMRYHKHIYDLASLELRMSTLFHSAMVKSNGQCKGGDAKTALIFGPEFFTSELLFIESQPANDWFWKFQFVLRNWYLIGMPTSQTQSSAPPQNHDAVEAFWEEILKGNGWTDDDYAGDLLQESAKLAALKSLVSTKEQSHVASTTSQKRSRDDNTLPETSENSKKRRSNRSKAISAKSN